MVHRNLGLHNWKARDGNFWLKNFKLLLAEGLQKSKLVLLLIIKAIEEKTKIKWLVDVNF